MWENIPSIPPGMYNVDEKGNINTNTEKSQFPDKRSVVDHGLIIF